MHDVQINSTHVKAFYTIYLRYKRAARCEFLVLLKRVYKGILLNLTGSAKAGD